MLEVSPGCCCHKELSLFIQPEGHIWDICVPALLPTPGRATARPLQPAPQACHPCAAFPELGHESVSSCVSWACPTPEPTCPSWSSVCLPAVSEHSGCSPGKLQPPGACGPCSSPLCQPRRQPPGVFPLQPLGGSGAEAASRLPRECILRLTRLWLRMQLTAPQPQFPIFLTRPPPRGFPEAAKVQDGVPTPGLLF